MEEGPGQVYTTWRPMAIMTQLCSSPNLLGDIGGSLLGSGGSSSWFVTALYLLVCML